MKTYGVTFILGIVFCFTASVNAQDYAFKVLVNKGKNEVKAGDKWQPLKTGTTLHSTDEVKLVDNAYVGLIHASGKPLELKQAGSYKVIELSARVNGGTSVLNKYTDFILSSNSDKKNRLAATGAVHRGGSSTKVFLPKPEHAVLYGNTLILDWEKEQSAEPVTYIVTLKSMFGDDLYNTETKAKTVTVDLSDPKFVNEDNIMIEVYPKGQESKKPDPAYMIKKLSTADKDRIKLQLNEISGQTNDASALNKLILAGFYEQNKLLIDASTAYLEAIQLAPDVPDYQEAYNNFLLRNGIKEEKKDK
jgi:hypothetical protein